MGKKDPRIDAYIGEAREFARPILRHLRKLVHAGCPEVEESMRWGSPTFLFHGILCGMAAFQQHCVFGFWNRSMNIPDNAEAMGQFGRILALSDLPSDRVIIGYVKEAARLNEAGIKGPAAPRRARKAIPVPDDFQSALKKSPKARAAFENFSPSHKREYLEWITEAKREDTRKKRLDTAIAWMSEGKPRNWKYMKQGSGGTRSPASSRRRAGASTSSLR